MITFTKTRTRKPSLSFFNPKRNLLLILLCSFALVLASCGDNSTGTNGGTTNNGGSDGTNNNGGTEIGTDPTFTNVLQIFESSCAGASCHINTSTNGVRLDTYENVMNSRGAQYGELVVQPEDAEGSPLVDKIEPNPQFGVRMPQTGNYLSDERIDQIKTWINEGAKNN